MKTFVARLISLLATVAVLVALVPQTTNAASTGTSDFVTRFYQQCLNRTPDPVGLEYWVNLLDSKQKTGADVACNFVNSAEFVNRNLSNDQYVNTMYAAFFNRTADSGGYNSWMNALNSGLSRLYVLSGFVNSQEFINLCTGYGINPGSLTLTDPIDMYPNISAFVIRFYRNCLGREADPAGLRMWVNNLQTGAQTACDVAYGFTYSKEFLNRGLSNSDFIYTMYAAFFNRSADAEGYNTWIKYLSAGYTKQYVLAGFVNSQEFKNLCATYGINPGSLSLKQEDTSIGIPYPCYFQWKINTGEYTILWEAPNTSGKTMGNITVKYYAYDRYGNQLEFTTFATKELVTKYTGTCSPFSRFRISDNLKWLSGTVSRIVIGEITIEYTDGSKQTIWYGQEAGDAGYSYDSHYSDTSTQVTEYLNVD